jgi:hypothetical protein
MDINGEVVWGEGGGGGLLFILCPAYVKVKCILGEIDNEGAL